MQQSEREAIAIVGMGCRLPGGLHGPRAYWAGLLSGVDGVRTVPADRWNLREFCSSDGQGAGRMAVQRGGFLDGIDQFDAAFFGIFPKEAERIDPQQRLLLQTSYEALEDAGDRLEDVAGSRTAVYMASFMVDYWLIQADPSNRRDLSPHVPMGLSLTSLSNRLSYFFDFKGPSVSLDTACSGSLTAVHLACQSLWRGEVDAALAGGVNVILNPESTLIMSAGSFLSPDGACKAFDARANGYVRSEGVGVVYLKPLSRAQRDGNHIYAVIRGTACNSDGYTPRGFTVPSETAQTQLLQTALSAAGATPDEIGYIEAHGTGTQVGDPIEVKAFFNVFGQRTEPLRIGSVKTNIGHTESVAGVAGLIKAALCAHHGRIPGNLHFQAPNPDIPFADWKLQVVDQAMDWPTEPDTARLAGVNSFGAGGTNVHVVLQGIAAPLVRAAEAAGDLYLYALSAATPESLRRLVAEHIAYLPQTRESLRDICASLLRHRSRLEHQLYIVAADCEDLIRKLQSDPLSDSQADSQASSQAGVLHMRQSPRRRLAFVFTGQGPQWHAMGRTLWQREPVFRRTLETIEDLFHARSGWSLLEELSRDEASSRIDDTRVAQPAIMAVQIGLIELYRQHGIEPDAVMGHSIGEVAAAYCAGSLTLEDAVTVIYQRSHGQHRASGLGRMLAVGCSLDVAQALIASCRDRVSIAAVNGPESLTLSGDREPLEALAQTLQAREIFCRFLSVNVPFHSHHMERVRDDLVGPLASMQPRRAGRALYSTVTGQRADGLHLSSEYWYRNVRDPVLFLPAMQAMLQDGIELFVELGPHPILSRDMRALFEARGASARVYPSLRRDASEKLVFLSTVAALQAQGHALDVERIYPGAHHVPDLPLYPWDNKSFWQESPTHRAHRLTARPHPLVAEVRVSSVRAGAVDSSLDLDSRCARFLLDHRVEGTVVLPGTAHLELALAVARQAYPEGAAAIEEVRFESALFLPEDQQTLAARVEIFSDEGDYRLLSRLSGHKEASWQKHSSGRICRGTVTPQSDAPCLAALQARLQRTLTIDTFYPALARGGLPYGPAFRGVQTIWHQDDEVLAEIRVSPSLYADQDRYHLHPAVLDACLQPIFAAKLTHQEEHHGIYLPATLARYALYARATSDVLFSYVRVSERSTNSLVGDLWIFDAQGVLVATLTQLRLRHLEGSGTRMEREAPYANTYVEVWQPLAELQPQEPAAEPTAAFQVKSDAATDTTIARVLLLGEPSPFAQQLQAALQTRGCSAQHVDGTDLPTSLNGVRDFVLLSPLFAPNLTDADSADQVGAAAHAVAWSVVPALQSLIQRDVAARVWVLTHHRVAAGDALSSPRHPLQSVCAGLARVFSNEHPKAQLTLIDLDAIDRASAERVASVLTTPLPEDIREAALRGPQLLVRRLQRLAPEQAEQQAILPLPGSGGPYHAIVRQKGSLDSLVFREIPPRPLGSDEVEIEVRAAGLNFKDVMNAMGLLAPEAVDGGLLGARLGLECAGVVRRVGHTVTTLSPGDAVMGFAPSSLSGLAITPEHVLMPKPTHLSFVEAAALPTVYLTAYYALVTLARLRRGERVLIHAGAGGVGIAAIHLAKRVGAEIFATVSSEDKRAYLMSLGVTHIYNSRSLDFYEGVMRDSGGVDVVLNSLSGRFVATSLRCLRPFGRFIEIGKTDIYGDASLQLKRFGQNLSYFAVDVDRMLLQRPDDTRQILAELSSLFAGRELPPHPLSTFSIHDLGRALSTLAQAKQIGKVVVDMQSVQVPVLPAEQLTLSAERAYLITGGTSGLGLRIAAWLTARGARHLILVSRSGPKNDADRASLATLIARGITVQVCCLDLSRSEQVDALFAELATTGQRLAGIVHAAAVLEDATLPMLTPDSFQNVFRPKALGVWNLHRASLAMPLDFFVAISSLSAVVGLPGQAAYCAANNFLDSLMAWRRGRGLPGLSLQLGVLESFAGMTSRDLRLLPILARQGWAAMSADETWIHIERALLDRAAVRLCAVIDWAQVGHTFPHMLHDSLYHSVLRDRGGMGSTSAGQSPRQRFLAMPSAAALADLSNLLATSLAQIVGVDPATIPRSASVSEMGLDSLMLTQLRNWITQKLDINIPLMRLAKGPSIDQLSQQLLDELSGSPTLPATAPTAALAEAPDGLIALGEWFVAARPLGPTRRRLAVLFHAMGTGASMFLRMLANSPSGCDVVAVQLPGRENRAHQSVLADVESLYAGLHDPLAALVQGRDCVFYGHSFGGILAYEMARRMRAQGARIERLVVSSTLPPSLTESWRDSSGANPYQLTEAAYQKLMASVVSDAETRERESILRLFRRDLGFLSTYRFHDGGSDMPALDIPIVAAVADRDPLVTVAEMRHWSALTHGAFQQHEFTGDHWFVAKHWAQLTALLTPAVLETRRDAFAQAIAPAPLPT